MVLLDTTQVSSESLTCLSHKPWKKGQAAPETEDAGRSFLTSDFREEQKKKSATTGTGLPEWWTGGPASHD
jgi:hypothetical protein